MGVFAHGMGARELELMVDYGMKPAAAIQSATSVAAGELGLGSRLGKINPGFEADLVAVEGNPLNEMSAIRKVRLVVKQGQIVHYPTKDSRP